MESNDFHRIVEEESGRSSSVDYLDTYDDIPKESTKGYSEGSNQQDTKEVTRPATFIEHEKKPYEAEKKQTTQPADTTTGNREPSTGLHGGDARQEERVGASCVADGRESNGNAAVGEWNSLPVLVERLRAALERSLATGSRRDDEPTPTVPEDSGIDSEEDLRIRSSVEQVLGNCKEPELKKDLKFLEELLLSDIQTALSRLRETLERIDVAVLARNGAASDPTSKLHLLRLVSSLLARLQVPEEATERIPVLPSTSSSRRRRGTRHTIGVSTEELALARKWLEEQRSSLPLDEVLASREQKEQPAPPSIASVERKPDEIRDKCTKDAINQRQLLEDKNKEIRESVLRGIQQVDPVEAKQSVESMYQTPYRGNNYQGAQSNEDTAEDNEERSRVSKLAAALRQRAELAVSGGGKYGAGNKFTAKKTKIKRANTIDIPSYLKLQADSLGHETTGCISLRRPIHVGDKAFNSANVAVPALQPKTENDRKFLALITKNNEAPTVAPVAPFKALGFTKAMDMSSLTNQQWNSRFSNIKTTFDKPLANEDRENKASSKSRLAKRFSGVFQTQVYGTPSERAPASSSYNAPMMNTDSTGGFRHAPSSPFRRIEKPSPVPPSKVPASYHWPKSAPVPSSTLLEKARMMFDRESVQPSSRSRQDAEGQEKSSFPRPPWIDQERNAGKANGTVTENGKLDYRSFCKQFAPFVGKGSSVESKKLEEQRQRGLAHRDRLSGVVDGKFSFKMVPDKRSQAHQYPPVERPQGKEKFRGETRNMFEVVKSGRDSESSKTNTFPDATLRGSSSVAVQTGLSDDHQDEGRSFRVAPKIIKGPGLVCSNASVQTSSDFEKPMVSVGDVDSGKQWKPLCYERPDCEQVPSVIRPSDDRQRFVLDHNQNYHTVPSDSEMNDPLVPPSPRQAPNEQACIETVPSQLAQTQQKQAENEALYPNEDKEIQSYSSSLVPPSAPNYSKSNEPSDVPEEKVSDWPTESSSFPDDENIQNQDISPDIGVVTRYTCAIATVASSADSPEPRSEEVAVDSRASSSPSPSQWSWSKSRPPTNETASPEDEIRRHNLLQQSLVRRLQNEITTLNDPPPTFGQHLSVNQPRSFNPPSNVPQSQPALAQPSSLNQSVHSAQSHESSFAQSHQFISSQPSGFNQPLNVPQSHQSSFNQPSIFNQPSNVPQSHQSSFSQPANFDQPSNSHVSSRFAKFLAPVPQKKPDPPRAHSPGPVTANRVGALRDAYEQAPSTPTKPIHKERSPIPNGVTPIDSSDEYLVSCATKPSRSIVLSKSESWHQLAVSNSYPRAPRVNVTASSAYSTSTSSASHPKPPKPRSPSSQKLRSKQYEASSMADSVKKMEDKIRQYFDSPPEATETRDHVKHRRSPRGMGKGMVSLSRSRTMPGISENEKLRLRIPAGQQVPLSNMNTADVDKAFDDLFEEATRIDSHHC